MEDSILDYLLKQGPLVAVFGSIALLMYRRSERAVKELSKSYERWIDTLTKGYEGRINEILTATNKRITDILQNASVQLDTVNTAHKELMDMIVTHHSADIGTIAGGVSTLGSALDEQTKTMKHLSDLLVEIRARIAVLDK